LSTTTEFRAGLVIGTVQSVSAEILEVSLELDAPHGTALNARELTRFPRINGLVIVPSETGDVIGIITWMGVMPVSARPRGDVRGVVNLPETERRLRVIPLGTIRSDKSGSLEVSRGVLLFPTVGDPVLLPTADQVKTLSHAVYTDSSITIGTSSLTGGADVTVDIDRVFGRHLAILGNTGSGKSCSATLIIRKSIERAGNKCNADPRVRFIILDTNGEYSDSFNDLCVQPRRFAVEANGAGIESLRVPGWLWNSAEWIAFTGASPGAQAPFLRRALQQVRSRSGITDPTRRTIATQMGYLHTLVRQRSAGTNELGTANLMFSGSVITSLQDVSRMWVEETDEDLSTLLDAILTLCTGLIASHKNDKGFWTLVGVESWTSLEELTRNVLSVCGSGDADREVHEDDPLPFRIDELANLIELLALEDGGSHAWIAPLTFRLRTLLKDHRIMSIAGDSGEETGLSIWLERLLGDTEGSAISIIDLSLVPLPVLHIVVAVLGRVILEALERYRKETGETLPTVLVAEEAHTFLSKRSHRLDDGILAPADLCREMFERIAREGRKFGLSLVVTSQRPSELSETVLSQCNTFLVHRIVNDQDQVLVRRMVPDSLGSLLSDLPVLPSRSALLMGWAVDLPTLVQLEDLDNAYRPRSEDPGFFRNWTATSEARIHWSKVASNWTRETTDAVLIVEDISE
jgi:DNA helicase HerA-like ATPase